MALLCDAFEFYVYFVMFARDADLILKHLKWFGIYFPSEESFPKGEASCFEICCNIGPLEGRSKSHRQGENSSRGLLERAAWAVFPCSLQVRTRIDC